MERWDEMEKDIAYLHKEFTNLSHEEKMKGEFFPVIESFDSEYDNEILKRTKLPIAIDERKSDGTALFCTFELDKLQYLQNLLEEKKTLTNLLEDVEDYTHYLIGLNSAGRICRCNRDVGCPKCLILYEIGRDEFMKADLGECDCPRRLHLGIHHTDACMEQKFKVWLDNIADYIADEIDFLIEQGGK
jgi:hypothetical protein